MGITANGIANGQTFMSKTQIAVTPQDVARQQVLERWPEAWQTPDGSVFRCKRVYPQNERDAGALIDLRRGPVGEDWVTAARVLFKDDRQNIGALYLEYLTMSEDD
jgi:hypothetical protein